MSTEINHNVVGAPSEIPPLPVPVKALETGDPWLKKEKDRVDPFKTKFSLAEYLRQELIMPDNVAPQTPSERFHQQLFHLARNITPESTADSIEKGLALAQVVAADHQANLLLI